MSDNSRMLRAFFIAAALPFTAVAGQAEQPALQQASDLLQAGKPAEARDGFEAILSADPSSTAAQNGEVAASEQLALAQRTHAQMSGALETLMRAERLVPQSAQLACDLGILEDEMHLYPDAAKSLDRAAQLGYASPSLLYAQARVFLDEQQLGPAEEKMLAYLKLRPDDATAHFGLGRIYQLGLQFDKASGEFEESIRLQPAQTEAWFQLGDIALKQNLYDKALADFSKTLARNPKHGGALAGAGEACFHRKQYQQALDYLSRAVTAAPDYAPGHYYLGLTLNRLGRKDEAQRQLAAAAKLADAENRNSVTQYQVRTENEPQ
jgi:tetratricopeptide (TPR) repeat protein